VTGARAQTVRPATAADVKPLAAVMARAFYDDPPFMWMLPDPKTRLKRSRRFFASMAQDEALADGGVDVAFAGTEVASALLRSRLDQCDHDRLPAYPEASKPTSVPLYQHFGFEPTGNPELPDGAPPLTAMWRPAAAAPPTI
jgi:hypothetical protein